MSSLRGALSALLLAAAFSVPAHADEMGAVARVGGLDAKLAYCKTCHGPSAQGYRGWFMIPRLAGQNQEYIRLQLHAFVERRRTNPIMTNVAHALTPAMVAALAEHFHHLEARPIGGAPRGSIALGKQIYEDGLPDSNVPACYVCHAKDGKAQNDVPRLAGQLYEYVVGQLSNWDKVRGRGTSVDTSAIMVPTAHNLTKTQIEAVAQYVSNLQ